ILTNMEENKVNEGAAIENAALEAEAKPAKPVKEAKPTREAKPVAEAPAKVANEDFDWNAFENDLDLYGGSKEAVEQKYDESLSNVQVGEVVEGTVVGITKRE